MSIIYLLDPSKGTAFVIWEGAVTAEEWSQSVTAFLAETELHTIRCVIVDAQRVTDNSSITDADIEEITTIFAREIQSKSKAKFAVVSTDMFGRTGSAEKKLIRRGVPVVIFNHLATACVYLDIPLEETQRTLDELRAKLLSGGNQ